MTDAEIARRLEDLQRKQGATRLKLFGHWELDELRAFQRLAHAAFGERGMVELNKPRPGLVSIGYLCGRKRPGKPAPVKVLFSGQSHAELEAQVRLWKASQ